MTVDSEEDTWNIDQELLEVAIKDRKEKTGKYQTEVGPEGCSSFS